MSEPKKQDLLKKADREMVIRQLLKIAQSDDDRLAFRAILKLIRLEEKNQEAER